MNVRRFTRNPGWWRLFIVFAGLWYGGWLIGGILEIRDDAKHNADSAREQATKVDLYGARRFQGWYSEQELKNGLIKANAAGDTESATILALILQWKQGKSNWTEYDDAEPPIEGYPLGPLPTETLLKYVDPEAYEFRQQTPPTPWYIWRYMNPGVIWPLVAVILFPWAVFFSSHLVRYVIEGFIPEEA